jgi:hypothetical protein
MVPVDAKIGEMKTNYCLRACACYAIIIGLVAANGVYAQVSTINSATYHPREFNDVPGSTLVVVSNYPSLIVFSDWGVSGASGYANRDVWRFSNNGGTSAYQFQNDDFFQVSMTVTLDGNTISPRREAGFLFNTIGGDGQFIVNTDAHEVVAFGGPLPFYAFPSTFNSGATITLGMTYFLDGSGNRAIIYTANGVNSPALEFSNLEQGIINNTTLGGYFQIVNAPLDPNNSGLAVFQNISISAVPEPSVFALLSLGILPLLLRHRRI